MFVDGQSPVSPKGCALCVIIKLFLRFLLSAGRWRAGVELVQVDISSEEQAVVFMVCSVE